MPSTVLASVLALALTFGSFGSAGGQVAAGAPWSGSLGPPCETPRYPLA